LWLDGLVRIIAQVEVWCRLGRWRARMPVLVVGWWSGPSSGWWLGLWPLRRGQSPWPGFNYSVLATSPPSASCPSSKTLGREVSYVPSELFISSDTQRYKTTWPKPPRSATPFATQHGPRPSTKALPKTPQTRNAHHAMAGNATANLCSSDEAGTGKINDLRARLGW